MCIKILELRGKKWRFGEAVVTGTLSTFHIIDNYIYIYIIRSRLLILYDMNRHVLQMCILPPGVIWGSNNDVFCHIRLITWTPSTFQIVDKWCFKIWLGMSCRYAISFLNFYFHPWGQIRVEKESGFFQILVTWTPYIFQGIVNKW